MLEHTFCHIHGVGGATEKRLWAQGILTWKDLLDQPDIIPRISGREICSILEQSQQALDEINPAYFSKRLRSQDIWRLFPHFRDQSAYLDIETTGLGIDCEITTIALYDGDTVRVYINGRNIEQFLDDVCLFKVLITYNGSSFDIPFIEHFFQTKLDQAQIDLRYVLARLGCRGGLKGCEKQMGLNRGTLDGIDGAFAVLLWREYERSGNEAALETLLAYNIEDTVNLEKLMVEAYNRNVLQTSLGSSLLLPHPRAPQILHHPDPAIVDIIRRQNI